jgi:hypothetical protein
MSAEPTDPEPFPKPYPNPRNRERLALAGVCAIVLLLGFTTVASGAQAAAPGGNAGVSPMWASASGSNSSWAWGAAANLSIAYDFVGAYNNSSSFGGGNLTENGVYVALDERAAIGYANYVVVTAATSSQGGVFVTVRGADYAAEQMTIAAAGTFPAAGTYNATTPVPLVPMNFSLSASVATLTEVAGYLNYSSGANGSIALENEHLSVVKGIAVSLSANGYPNVTSGPNGSTTLRYVSGAVAEDAWVAMNFTAAFSPAFALIQGPVHVGANWVADSTAGVNGTTAYAAQYVASVPGGASVRSSEAGATALSATAAVSMDCTVIGTQSVRLPNGTSETDYVIQYAVTPGSSNWTVADGLFVLPGGNGTSNSTVADAVPEHPVRSAAASAAPSDSARSLYSTARGLPDSERANPSGAGSVTASPMTPAQATAAMDRLATPHVDLGGAPSVNLAIIFVAVLAVSISLVGIVLWHRRQLGRVV